MRWRDASRTVNVTNPKILRIGSDRALRIR